MTAYADRIRENQMRFDEMVSAMSHERDDEAAMAIAENAARFASLCGVARLASPEIERNLRLVAERLDGVGPVDGDGGGTLLVATELYPVGGHTKVLGRLASMLIDGERVSLVLTRSGNHYVSEELLGSVKASGGEVVMLEDESRLVRAARLRAMAFAYDRSILMVHPEDATAVVAFGTARFNKPVFYFNHANHTFWLGVSIADRILDVNKWGVELSCRLRGVNRESIESLGIPVEEKETHIADGSAVRTALGIPESGTLVTAAGSPRKFRNFEKWRFGDLINKVLEENQSAHFLVIGAEPGAYPEWQWLSRRFGPRLKLVPQMPYARLLQHFAASDVVVDSFPMSGWTSMMDAVRQKTATVYPAGVTGPMDYFADSSAFAPDITAAASIIKRLLDDKNLRTKNIAEMTDRMKESMNPVAFRKRLSAALHSVSGHSIRDFAAAPEPEDSPLSAFIYAMTIRSKIRFALPGVVLKSVREGVTKHYELSLFGGRMSWRF